jgi:hypothetical protein
VTAQFTETVCAAAEAVRERWASSVGDRYRRQMVRLIDLAIGQCEERNLGDRAVPAPMSRALIEWLQLEAGEDPRLPESNQAALDELFRLQERYLRTVRDKDLKAAG